MIKRTLPLLPAALAIVGLAQLQTVQAASKSKAPKPQPQAKQQQQRPNLLYIIADEWRAQSTGYNGDVNVRTPNLDAMAREGIDFSNAVTAQPLSSPYRACLLSGQFTTTNGMVENDQDFRPTAPTLGELFKGAGYATGYVGKWHLFGGGRQSFIPAEKRFGFDFWRVMNCTHDYNKSYYWGEEPVKKLWDGYDAFAQAKAVESYLEDAAKSDKPFCMFLSWGPPHPPYNTAPKEYAAMYKNPSKIVMRGNVPADNADKYRNMACGYYSHMAALDHALGELMDKLRALGLLDNTIVVFTADHGDMLGSHNYTAKSRPYDESIRVPLLVSYPPLAKGGKTVDEPITTPDITATLLDLCGIAIPKQMQGRSFAGILGGKQKSLGDCALVQWPLTRQTYDLDEYRCLRTRQYTYVETLKGAWLLFDDVKDPLQMDNLAGKPEYAALQAELKSKLHAEMERVGDKFMPDAWYREHFNIDKQK